MSTEAHLRVRRLRRQLGLAQAPFAELLGVTSVTISRWESGRVESSPLAWQRLRLLEVNACPPGAAIETSAGAQNQRDADHPAGLPRPISTFIGRESALAELAQLALANRLVVLTGAGGAGKTRLAIELAPMLAPAFERVTWVDLTAVQQGELVPLTVATALGIREQGEQPLTTVIASAIGSARLLMLLDNCEHLTDASSALAGALLHACPGLHLLATSREMLGVSGELLWAVPSLGLPKITGDQPGAESEAIQSQGDESEAECLFADRARTRDHRFILDASNRPAIADICRRLDGLPLAIELAAAWIPVLSAAEIAARLDDRFRLLTRSPRGTVPRHRSLRAALDWSFDLLSEVEQRLLVGLSVFVGGCTLEAIQTIGIGECPQQADVLPPLSALVEKSLVIADVRPAGTRYRLLETVRAYGHERLEGVGAAAAVRRRHAESFLAYALALERQIVQIGTGEVFERLEEDLGNFRAGLQWFLQQREQESYLQLVAVVSRLWVVRGQWLEGWNGLQLALPMRNDVTPNMRSLVLNLAANFAQQLGRMGDARELYEEAIVIGQQTDNPLREGQALANLGDIVRMLGKIDEARQLLRSGIAAMYVAAERSGITTGQLGVALGVLGLVEQQAGDGAAAEERFRESRGILAQVDYQYGIAIVLCNQAVAAIIAGDSRLAHSALEQSLSVFEEIQAPTGRAVALGVLGMLALVERDDAAASVACHEALSLFAEHSVFLRIPTMLQALAVVASRLRQHRRALTLATAASNIRPGAENEFPFLRALLANAVERSRAALGNQSIDAAEAAGRALSAVEATTYALPADTQHDSLGQIASAPRRNDAALPLVRQPTGVHLSRREQQVLDLLAEGWSARQMAEELVLSVRTVERHIAGMYAKIGARGRAEAIVYAYQQASVQP